ncbi:MAG TPA: FG-GAP-like repeat-containing protein [Bryobacteraceae bacterium]|nr:FG-GAP-like repeat-containing protein [Bryobacteraceae bacterium]
MRALVAHAQVSPCQPINFAQASSQVTLDSESSATTFYIGLLDRQADGNFTAPFFSIAAPMISHTGAELASLTQAQSYFANCFGVSPWTPAAHPTRMADTPGTMASSLVVANLGGGKTATIIPNPVINTGDTPNITVSLDSQDTLGQSKISYPLPYNYPIAVLAADFNGDGKRDVAVLNTTGPPNTNGTNANGTVQILLGNGDGTLGAAKSYGVGRSPSSMTWADFNHDGRADLAVVNNGDYNGNDLTVTILLGNADGSLRTANTYDLGTNSDYPGPVVAGDFDGDGKIDLMVFDGYNSGFYLLRGNGDGTFQAASKVASASGYQPLYLASGDFNKDGKLDLAVENDDGTVVILLNAGGGSFPTQSRYVAGTPRSLGAGMFAMDFNDDGNLDLVFASGHPDVLYPGSLYATVLFGNGDGTFQNAPAAYNLASWGGYGVVSLAMADFNGDGLRDVVMGTNYGPYLALGQSGGLQAPRKLTSVRGTFVATADVNGDGRADLVLIDGTNVGTYLGNGDGTFQAEVTYAAGPGFPTFVTAGDVNGDGRSDVAVAYGSPYDNQSSGIPSSVLVFTTKSGGGFNSGVTVPTGTNTVQVALADVNADGKLDLIAVNLGYAYRNSGSTVVAGSVTVSLGKGDGTFQAPVPYTVGQNPISLAVADVNGDGKPDLIVGTVTASAADIAVLLGKGDGTFTVPTTLIGTYSWPAALTVADFDGDGKPDLAIGNSAGDSPMTIMQGNGDGTFQMLMMLQAGDTPAAAIAADFTGDGRPDLALLDAGGEGNGASYFALFRNTSPSSACTYALNPGATAQPVAATGGAASFRVIAGTGCDWAAGSSASWISLAFPAYGSNNGAVAFSVAPNTGAARSGTITAGGQSFTVNQASAIAGGTPQAVSVDPPAATGSYASYTFTFSDSAGWQSINVANILINNFVDGRNGCYVAVVPSSSSVYLVDDGGDAGGPYQGMTLPGSGTVQNSQCSISDTGSSIAGSGNNLTVTLAITFKAAFAGSKVMYLAAREPGGANSGWQAMGTCGVPGTSPTGPAVGGVTPGRSSGSGGGPFTFTFTDTNGWLDLGVVNVLINDALNGNQACYLAYSRAYNTLYLVNDAGTALLPGVTLNGAGSVNNSQCTVTGAGSSASGSGNTLTLTLNMSFPSAFAGNRIIYAAARSNGDALNSGWQAAGSRTVQ